MTEQHTFAEAFDLLLKIQSTQSKNTFAQARCVIGHVSPWFSDNCPHLGHFEKNYEEIWAMYRSAQVGIITRRGKQRKLGHDRRYLIMALKRAQNKGWITRSFTKKDFVLKEAHEDIGRALSDDEVKRLLSALERHPRTHLQVRISLTMGMRYSEILKLRVDEVDLTKKVINLDGARLKTRRPRKVPIPISNTVHDELAQRVQSAQGIFVFPMERSANEAQADNRFHWEAARRASGVQCRFHDLRHTWATNMIARGTPQDYIVKVGGFTPQVMSRVYSHMQEDAMDEFRSAFDGRFNDRNKSRVSNGSGNGILARGLRLLRVGVLAA